MKKPDPFIRLSASKMGAVNCPYYFYNQYLDENAGRDIVDNRTPLYLIVGRYCHQVLEEYNKILLKSKVDSDMELFNELFDTIWEAYDRIPEKLHDETKQMMIGFAETHVIDRATIYGSEVPVAFDWDMNQVDFDNPDVWIRAKLDRVNIYPTAKTAVITDYKTARWIPSVSDLKKSLQALIYPFMMWKLNPYLLTYRMVWHFIRWNKKVEVDFTAEDMAGTEDSLRAFTVRLSKKLKKNKKPEDWPAITGENCGICRYECPLVDEDFRPLQTVELARQVAMQLVALERKKKKLENELKDYVKSTEGQVDIADGVYDFSPQTILTGVKPSGVVNICNEKNFPVDSILSFDSTKFRKITDPEVRAAIESLGKPGIRSYFKFIPSQPEDEATMESGASMPEKGKK